MLKKIYILNYMKNLKSLNYFSQSSFAKCNQIFAVLAILANKQHSLAEAAGIII